MKTLIMEMHSVNAFGLETATVEYIGCGAVVPIYQCKIRARARPAL